MSLQLTQPSRFLSTSLHSMAQHRSLSYQTQALTSQLLEGQYFITWMNMWTTSFHPVSSKSCRWNWNAPSREITPITLKLGSKEFPDKLHIYHNVYGVLISWKACKDLGIVLDCYPHPPVNITSVNKCAPLLNKDSIITEFPSVWWPHKGYEL